MKKVILHHTCKQDGGEDFVLENAPFLAKDNHIQKKYLFLGEGYYFWEDDIEQAHKWGKTHYRDCYFIVEFDCEFDETYLLDLNDRSGQKYLLDIKQKLELFLQKKIENWSLSQLINFLLKGKELGIDFDYRIFKVRDNFSSNRMKNKIQFVSNKSNTTNIRDVFIIVFKDKRDIHNEKKQIK